MILAANLIVVSAYDGIRLEGDLSVPADLAFFLEDTSTDRSLKFAKDKMDATGHTPPLHQPRGRGDQDPARPNLDHGRGLKMAHQGNGTRN